MAIFYFFTIVNKSHENTRTDNVLIQLPQPFCDIQPQAQSPYLTCKSLKMEHKYMHSLFLKRRFLQQLGTGFQPWLNTHLVL